MPRPDYPDTMRDARSVRAGILLGVMDFVLLAMAFLWLVFVCGGISTANPETRITLLHLAHLALAVPAILLFALSVLFLPIWFAVLGLIVFFIDVFALVARFQLLATSANLFCTVFLLLFDGVFLLLAVMYMAFAIVASTRFGLFGSTDDVITPYTLPRAAYGSGKGDAAPVPPVYIADAQAAVPTLLMETKIAPGKKSSNKGLVTF